MGVSASGRATGEIARVPVRSGGHARWADLVAEYEAYREDKADDQLVFVGQGVTNHGEIRLSEYTHRFTEQYARREYARMQDFVRGARAEYDDPYIVILPALTASTITPAGQYRAPLDHFDQLKRSWSRGVRYELHHSMEADRKKDRYPAREWEYLQVWEPTTDQGYAEGGYPHCHPVVVCDGKVGAERFRSVMDKHVEKCEWAAPEAHDIGEIDIRPLDELSNPAAYLFKYLSKSWEPDEASPRQKRFNALLKETDYRRVQPSQGAQRWMKRDEGEATESWMYAGVAEPEEAARLEEFQDAHEFQIEYEMGVAAYLAQYEAPAIVGVDAEESGIGRCEHQRWDRGRCVACGVSELDIVSGYDPPPS